MKTIPSSISLSYAASFCLRQLNHFGFEAYVVGGAVRDALLEKESHDFDLTTNATPDEIESIFSHYPMIKTGKKYGTLILLIQHEPIEITTYRIEKYDDNHRSPSVVQFTPSLKEDCKRRDFTINALCYHPENGIIDFFNGLYDLKHQIIKCIGDPNERFNEDALRILRALRFSAEFNFKIDDTTSQSMFKNTSSLQQLSKERVTNEMKKLLCAPYNLEPLLIYKEIFFSLFPELNTKMYDEKVNLLSMSDSSFIIRLALLSSPLEKDQQHSFLNRWALSNKQQKTLQFLLGYQNAPCSTKSEIKKILSVNSREFLLLVKFKESLDPTSNFTLSISLYHEIIRNNECFSLSQLAINGFTLQSLNFPRHEFSSLLNDVLTQVIEEKLPNRKDDIIQYLSKKNPK